MPAGIIEVAVMYVDPVDLTTTSIQRAELNEIDVLVATYGIANVLAISVRDTAIDGKQANIAFVFGLDNYCLARKQSGGKDFVMLFGWDDDQYVWKQVDCRGCKVSEAVDPPLGVMHTIFRGKGVSPEAWATAEIRLNAEMLSAPEA